ncbi:hypothetical protein F511_13163 [Dorcoceras hygrometricum]|uniref:VQ domain-containing protein n=1 Tax=Dorcoceras hygrometricum TaxID=472368 RepID=A0A2Z7DAX8_9LAMI|nr:hypothetical protein F511_13163 [Dorcoceras hygrometricum]
MSPSKFQGTEASKGVVENAGNGNVPAPKNHTKRQLVIIYTHSPKAIHAQASDFMALVQKLTGYSWSTEEEEEEVEEGRSSVKPDIAVKDEGKDSRP